MSPTVRTMAVNAALGVVALALLGLVLATAGSVTTSEREARSSNVMTAFREEEIARIVVERPNSRFVLERQPVADGGVADWILKAPHEEEADLFAIQSALGTLEFASWVRRIKPEEVDRAAFGLDSPSLVIHVDMENIHYRLRLGKAAASPPGSHYLEVTGEGTPRKDVVIVDKALVKELSFEADDFRGRYIIPYLSQVLEQFTLSGVGGERRFKRGAWDGWRFDGQHGDARVNRQVLDRVLAQFARTVAEEFLDPKDAEALQRGTELITVSMMPKGKRPPGKVIVGGTCADGQSIVARRIQPDALAGCVPANVFSGLAIPADVLVDRTLFHMRPDEVETMTVRQGNRQLELARKGDGFILRKPREAAVDGEAGNARLEALWRATGTVVESPNLEALGLIEPDGTLTVTSAAADDSAVKRETVELSAPTKNGTVYARREHDGVVIGLEREAARSLHADASLVRSRAVFDRPISEMRSVTIEGTPRQVFERTDTGEYMLKVPSGFRADGLLCTEVMDALRTLTAERWVADEDDGSFGLQDPALAVTFTTQKDDDEAEPVEHRLVIGRPVASGFYAQVSGDPGVFVLPRRVQEALTTLTLDRSRFMVDSDATTRVTLKTPERQVLLERVGELFIQSQGSERLEPAAIRRVLDALTTLRAEAAISLGPAKPEHGFSAPVLAVEVEGEAGLGDASRTVRWKIGSGDSWRGIAIRYGRIDGADATYGLPRSSVQQILDAL